MTEPIPYAQAKAIVKKWGVKLIQMDGISIIDAVSADSGKGSVIRIGFESEAAKNGFRDMINAQPDEEMKKDILSAPIKPDVTGRINAYQSTLG